MADSTPDILKRILLRKQQEISIRKQARSEQDLIQAAQGVTAPRGFVRALQEQVAKGLPAVIAEIKKASPSKGVIREDFDPRAIADSYANAGASCLSVLTDEYFFQGHDDYLILARETCSLPVIRKDFMIDAYQVYEARALGADCILLIAACLDDESLHSLYHLARELGMDVLVEVHNRQELDRAIALKVSILGINNRDLRSFDTSLLTTIDLLDHVPADCIVVTESGIHKQADVKLMRSHGVNAFLVGEAFMRAEHPGDALRDLFFNEN